MTDDRPAGLDACAAIARRHDRERYLACLFAPAERRAALFAVLAANHEIAKTAEVVSDPTIGRIRLQWWRDSLDGIEAGTPRAHEVVQQLAEAVTRDGRILDRLRAVVDAREADLDGEAPETLDDLEAYAADTAGVLHAALADLLGADPEAAAEAGTAWGLVGLMRASPLLIAAGRVPLPNSLLEESGLSHQKIKDSGAGARIANVVRPVVQRAEKRLDRVRQMGSFRDPAFRALRLLADRAGDHANALTSCGFEPFDLPLEVAPAGPVWRYAARALRYRLGL